MSENETKENEARILIAQSIVANEIALDFNHKIKHTVYYKQKLKNVLNAVQVELTIAERKEYDLIFKVAEKESCNTYQATKEMVEEICSLGLINFDNITTILKAFKKDPASINGIVNKINKSKK